MSFYHRPISPTCLAGGLTPLLIFIALCTGCAHDHDHAESTDHEEEESPFGVTFHDEMQQRCDFALDTVRLRQGGAVIHTLAQVEAGATDLHPLIAQTSGCIHLAEGQGLAGTEVKAGQWLCTIDASTSADDNLEVRLQQAQAEYERAKSQHERAQSLVNDQLMLTSEAGEAEAAFRKAEAELQLLNRHFTQGRQRITAPHAGTLVRWEVTEGSYVTAGQTLGTIRQGRQMQLRAEVRPSQYSLLPLISGANLGKSGSDEVKSLEALGGRLLSYGRELSAGAALIPVYFAIDWQADLLPGSYVDLYIQTRSEEKRLSVPRSALLEEMGNYFVYVQLHDEYFEKRQVHIGSSDGRYTEVLSGVKEGEIVVSRGAQLVKMQSASGQVAPHNHEH